MTTANTAAVEEKKAVAKKVEPAVMKPTVEDELKEALRELRSIKRERTGLNKQIKELEEKVNIAKNKSERMFKENRDLKQELYDKEQVRVHADGLLLESISNAFQSHKLAVK